MNGIAAERGEQDLFRAIPVGLNFSLAIGYVLLNLYLFFILPIWLLPRSPWWGLTLIAAAALSNPFWSLIHETIHELFHPRQLVNALCGRLLSILFGAPFRVLRLSHLLHHKLNRTPLEGTELYDPEKSSRLRASLGYYSYIFGGLYLLEVLSPLLFFLPGRLLGRLQQRYFDGESLGGIWFRSLTSPEAVREVRTDGVLILALLIVSFSCYGKHWEWLLVSLIARAFLVSFLDNVYHYRTPVNDVFYASNLWLPPLMAKAFLYFNLHGVHHKNPSIPWLRLPEASSRGSEPFSANYFAAALQQLYGPVSLQSLSSK